MKSKINRFLDEFPVLISGIALTVAISLSSVNALGRYLFAYTFAWNDEIVALCFCWTVFWGAAAASRRGLHFGLEVINNLLPPLGQKIQKVIIELLSCGILWTIAYLAWVLTDKASTKLMPATRLSYQIFDAGMALGMSLMAVYSVIILVGNIRNLFSKED